ncbi:MAG: DUF4962 domain-containing protein [Candidatus Brocadiae bacterium]|nr:DUF4962 domain-containing protein [Candidatus Brocadiia bacterium]
MSRRGGPIKLYNGAAAPGEWGHRPARDEVCTTNPPAFVWRPQGGAAGYELECSRNAYFGSVAYRAGAITYNCHCPPEPFVPGRWFWRFRYLDKHGEESDWCNARMFHIPPDAVAFAMPGREELLGRIPREHPRLFIRPEDLLELRKLAGGVRRDLYAGLVAECDQLLVNPPPTDEPPEYPPDMDRTGNEWRAIWWGNRLHAIDVLNSAATLAFTSLVGGQDDYAALARRLLLDAARWNLQGSTSFGYNYEAGLPYAYLFARAYTFLHDRLSEGERGLCRHVMTYRGREIHSHLGHTHIWRPFGSHTNRAWHFLGEVGIAFLDEIPDAAEWVWFAANVFFSTYPVWGDDDGGWHEGLPYWASYLRRFGWWADVMRSALGIDAFQKPYFRQAGYHAMYLQPPGARGTGFGDLSSRHESHDNLDAMSLLTARMRNPHWQWYVNAHGGAPLPSGYVGFVRGEAVAQRAECPSTLPTSRCFRGTGIAVLNTTLTSASDNVQVMLKSSPFGTQSHGYEAQNAFLLSAFGERLLIRSGRRDFPGSDHHRNWMWHTRSVNSITVNGQGQGRRVPTAKGQILAFHASPFFDYVAGEAGQAYGRHLRRFTRHVLFVKPCVLLIYDRLEAAVPSLFQWFLHMPTAVDVRGPRDIRVVNGAAGCRVAFLTPMTLDIEVTDRFDPPPQGQADLTECHLTAHTSVPEQRVEFITLIRPHRVDQEPPAGASVEDVPGGYRVRVEMPDGYLVVALNNDDASPVQDGDTSRAADLFATRFDYDGEPVDALHVKGSRVVGLKDMSSYRLIPPAWESQMAGEGDDGE